MAAQLVHITTAAPWRMALAVGAYLTPSLLGPEGCIHLSTPEQVHLPANRLFAGRDDLLLLVIDPARVAGEIPLEPGVPTDPESMRFPHLHGPLPTASVTSVLPWRAGPEGFSPPVELPRPDDLRARALAFDWSLMQRRAAIVRVIDGGFAVLDPRVAVSHEHNCVWLAGERSADEIHRIADVLLAGLRHRRVVLDEPPPQDLGWEVEEDRLMALDLTHDPAAPAPGAAAVVPVTTEVVGPFWRQQWRDSLPGVAESDIDQLIAREQLADVHVRVLDLAVLDGSGRPVASAQLRIDGATAALEAVMTGPGHEGKGLARALVHDAMARARGAGCDLILLTAAADDWPRQWYARLGFREIGVRWVCTDEQPMDRGTSEGAA